MAHAATLHSAPGQKQRIILARGIGLIVSPVTAGLYSLNVLGRMMMEWISIASRAIELLSQTIAPSGSVERTRTANIERSQTVNVTRGRALALEKETDKQAPVPGPRARPPVRRGSDPGPLRSFNSEDSIVEIESPQDQTRYQNEELQKSPIHSSINIISTALISKNPRRRKRSTIEIRNEMPHTTHSRAIIAGAVGIHVPKRYERLLSYRGWERLKRGHFREVSSEYTRLPSSDPAFQEFSQYILPPTALILDNSFRVYPESKFRDAAVGLLQFGFGLYQVISDDARMSVEINGLASPYMLVLPYLGMALVNTFINILDPPYSVITVLDVSERVSQAITFENDTTGFCLSPTTSISPNNVQSSSPSRRLARQPSSTSAYSKKSNIRFDSSVLREDKPLHSAPVTGSQTPYSTLAYSEQDGTWPELMEWLDIAYANRIDVCPVDRFYRTPWLSHAIIIGQFLWGAFNALLVPVIMLIVVGTWTKFRTSSYGWSLGFNILTLFGLPFVQFILTTSHSFVRLLRDLRGRKEHGADYWEPKSRDVDPEMGTPKHWWSWITKQDEKRSPWWDIVAQSVGLYFPVRKTVIFAYVFLVVGVVMCEFVFVGINLRRSLECNMSVLI